MMGQSALFFSCLVVVMLGFVPDAHAYLDPGTGSILFQALVALIAGVSLTMKLYWRKIRALLRREPLTDPENPSAPEDDAT